MAEFFINNWKKIMSSLILSPAIAIEKGNF